MSFGKIKNQFASGNTIHVDRTVVYRHDWIEVENLVGMQADRIEELEQICAGNLRKLEQHEEQAARIDELTAALSELLNRVDEDLVSDAECVATEMAFQNAINVLSGATSPAAGDGWISIKDQWPEPIDGNKVIGYGAGYLFECEWDGDDWCNIGGENMTHWMPIPQPPQGRES